MDESTRGLWRRVSSLPRNVFAISLVSLLNDASSEIIYPMLPPSSRSRSARRAEGHRHHRGRRRVGLKPPQTLLRLLQRQDGAAQGDGRLRLRVGERDAPAAGLRDEWSQVLAVRFADRVGKGVRSAPRDAMIADAAAAHRARTRLRLPPRDGSRGRGARAAHRPRPALASSPTNPQKPTAERLQDDLPARVDPRARSDARRHLRRDARRGHAAKQTRRARQRTRRRGLDAAARRRARRPRA